MKAPKHYAPKHYIEEIISRLSDLEPHKIVLFGSQASGTSGDDSDIDLLVVLDSNAISQTYEEKMAKKLSVRDRILDISKAISVDLVVYTKAEYEMLAAARGSFVGEVDTTGRVLYEKTGSGVA